MNGAQHAWNWATLPREHLSDGIVRQMIYGETLMICRLTLAPGTITAAHDHVHEQMTIVEKGRVRFVVGSEERVFSPGDILLFPTGFRHGATILDEEVVLLDVFSPIRQEFLEAADAEVQEPPPHVRSAGEGSSRP